MLENETLQLFLWTLAACGAGLIGMFVIGLIGSFFTKNDNE
jgi:hypothetical protein